MQLAVMSAKSKRMKTRHTAALALVGWYLTAPMNLTGPGPWMAICWAQQGFQPFSPQSHPSSNNVQELPVVPRQISPSATTRLPTVQQYGGSQSADIGRPPPLQAAAGCELWRGTFSGNDPSVMVEARLCSDQQGHVSGLVQWSSLRSGYNLREIEGLRASDGNFSLYDKSFREYHPRFGWRFCLIDRYSLTREGAERLVGSYVSHACQDDAQVDLNRVGTSN